MQKRDGLPHARERRRGLSRWQASPAPQPWLRDRLHPPRARHPRNRASRQKRRRQTLRSSRPATAGSCASAPPRRCSGRKPEKKPSRPERRGELRADVSLQERELQQVGNAGLLVLQLFECLVDALLAERVNREAFNQLVFAAFGGDREAKHHILRNAVLLSLIHIS